MKISLRDIIIVLASVVISVGITATGAWFLLPGRIVEFDVKGTVNLFESELGQANNLSATQRSALMNEFPKAMAEGATQYAAKHHAIVLVSPAVVAGANDATPAIQELIQNDMEQS